MNTNRELPHIQLATMSRWYVISRAIHTVAKLGLANHMSLQPMRIDDLAELTQTNPELLARLIRFLSAYNIFNYEENCCSLTELSIPLRDDAPNSIRDVLNMVDDSWWQAFSNLDLSLKTGTSAFALEHGEDFFGFISKHPEKQKNYDKGMAKFSSFEDEAVAKAYDFSQFSTLIDMGGGRGGLTKAIAQYNPSLQLTLFDTKAVIEQLDANDFSSKIQLVSGDFFSTIPEADAYIFKGVLHDFNDELIQKILHNCHKQMPKKASLLIAEQALPDNNAPHPNKTMDIVMMVLLGGKQRTNKEWQELAESSGFQYLGSNTTNSLFSLMEFKPV